MANKKAKKYREMSEKDLEKDLRSKMESLRKFRFGSAGSRSTNVKEAKNTKKDIARILTEAHARVKA